MENTKENIDEIGFLPTSSPLLESEPAVHTPTIPDGAKYVEDYGEEPPYTSNLEDIEPKETKQPKRTKPRFVFNEPPVETQDFEEPEQEVSQNASFDDNSMRKNLVSDVPEGNYGKNEDFDDEDEDTDTDSTTEPKQSLGLIKAIGDLVSKTAPVLAHNIWVRIDRTKIAVAEATGSIVSPEGEKIVDTVDEINQITLQELQEAVLPSQVKLLTNALKSNPTIREADTNTNYSWVYILVVLGIIGVSFYFAIRNAQSITKPYIAKLDKLIEESDRLAKQKNGKGSRADS